MANPAKPWLWGELLNLAAPATLDVSGEPEAAPWITRVDLSYIVVDELDDATAVLVIEDWPVIDEQGRRRFPGRDDRVTAAVSVAELLELLAERQTFLQEQPADSRSLAERPLRVGDAFGAHVNRDEVAKSPDQLREWLAPPLLDVSAPAREAAKTQYFAAVGPVLAEETLIAIAEEFFEGLPRRKPGDRR